MKVIRRSVEMGKTTAREMAMVMKRLRVVSLRNRAARRRLPIAKLCKVESEELLQAVLPECDTSVFGWDARGDE